MASPDLRPGIGLPDRQPPPANGADSTHQESSKPHLINLQGATIFPDSKSIISSFISASNNNELQTAEQPYLPIHDPDSDRDVAYPAGFRDGKIWGN